ncbi:hypothetical protein PDR5_16640 [Pseudomonas sp. DR 5-09]|nr:hypothetical protein PDR5_16640 [Pseudomonas sp. DR 5-09]
MPVLAVAHGSTGLARRSTMPRVARSRGMLRGIIHIRKHDSWQEAVCWC